MQGKTVNGSGIPYTNLWQFPVSVVRQKGMTTHSKATTWQATKGNLVQKE